MKKQSIQKLQTAKSTVTELNYSQLAHLLSPLEVIAKIKHYKPFNYRIGNTHYLIPQDFCYYLKAISKAKTELFLNLESKPTSQNHPDTKRFSRFIQTPITNHKLPKHLIAQLNEAHIYTMSEVIYYGVHKIAQLPHITKLELDVLMSILAENDGLGLFLREKNNDL